MATGRTIAAALGTALLLAGAASAQEQLDVVGTAPFPPGTPERLWVLDLAFNHLVDGRIHIVDPKAGAYLGQVPTGLSGFAAFSPDGDKLYVATTYYDRLTRGNKADVLEIYDVATLALGGEVLLPPKRAMVTTYKGMIDTTADGRFALVQNATPASSVTVVDLESRSVAGEIDTAGCWAIFPSQAAPRRFATVCGDGTLEAIELDDAGRQASRTKSQPLFDPDADPIFIQAESIGDVHYWVSFNGKLVAADLSTAEPTILEPWDFAGGVEGDWRPGGYNPLAAHPGTGKLYVGMHSGGAEGSHKNPAEEIWALDLAARTVETRAPGHEALALSVTAGDAPLVYALELGMNVVALDPANGLAEVARMDAVAETATYAIAR
jgi:methylamine dehydrogenase heavy chain